MTVTADLCVHHKHLAKTITITITITITVIASPQYDDVVLDRFQCQGSWVPEQRVAWSRVLHSETSLRGPWCGIAR